MIGKVGRIIVGIFVIIVGLVAYPHYIEHIIEPLQSLVTTMFPGMNVFETTLLQAVPLLILLLIMFFGIMHMFGKGGGGDIQGGDA